MLQRAWKHGIRVEYLLADSWFACEKLIGAVRAIGKGTVHYIGLGKMGKTRYEVRGRSHNANELVSALVKFGVVKFDHIEMNPCLYANLG